MKVRELKVFFILIGTFGILILCYCDYLIDETLFYGALWNLLCSGWSAVYAVGLNAVANDDFDYVQFLGFIGIINVVMMAPLMILLHFWEIQVFIAPSLESLTF